MSWPEAARPKLQKDIEENYTILKSLIMSILIMRCNDGVERKNIGGS